MLKIKVCGMRSASNIKSLVEEPIDFIGFIFYPKSLRYVKDLDNDIINSIPDTVSKVGVFVNEMPSRVLLYIKQYGLNYVQLHGDEDAHYCQFIKRKSPDVKVIKSFNISNKGDLKITEDYKNSCDYFLFDTKSADYGGSGMKFDWSVLDAYTDDTPFFLSGGISLDDVDRIKEFTHTQLYALDINSKFETEPGIKDIELIKQFIEKIQSNEQDKQVI